MLQIKIVGQLYIKNAFPHQANTLNEKRKKPFPPYKFWKHFLVQIFIIKISSNRKKILLRYFCPSEEYEML